MYVSSSFDLPLSSFDYLLTLSSIDLILMSSCKGPLSSFRSRNVEFGIEFEFGFELRFERRIKQGHLLQYNIISLTSWQSVTVEWRGRLWVGWVRTWYVLRLHRSDGSDNALALRQSGSKQSDISYLNKIYWKIKPLLSSFRDIIKSIRLFVWAHSERCRFIYNKSKRALASSWNDQLQSWT